MIAFCCRTFGPSNSRLIFAARSRCHGRPPGRPQGLALTAARTATASLGLEGPTRNDRIQQINLTRSPT
jgi:hypothetical protein